MSLDDLKALVRTVPDFPRTESSSAM